MKACLSTKLRSRYDTYDTRDCYAIVSGKLIILKKCRYAWYDISLIKVDEWIKQFKNGDNIEEVIAPLRMVKVNALTDLVLKGILKAVKANKITSYRLELIDDYWFLIGST